MLRSLCLETYGPNPLEWAQSQVKTGEDGAQALRAMTQGCLGEDTVGPRASHSLGSATREPPRQRVKLRLDSKAFNLQLMCQLLTLAPPLLPCPTPCQYLPSSLPWPPHSCCSFPWCCSSRVWSHPPSLLGGSRWGCCQSPCCSQHQHGQGLGPCGVDLLVPMQVGTPAEALAAERAGVGPDASVGALVGSEM